MIQLEYDPNKEFSGCWFCWPREQGTHGTITRVPSRDWGMLQACQKHKREIEEGEKQTETEKGEAT